MKRALKGHYGYLKQRKRNLLLLSVILFVIILGIAVYGLVMRGTTKNWYTIIAALLVIPMAMQLSTLIPMLKHKDRPQEEYDHIRALTGNGILDTGLLIAGKNGKAFELNYAYVHENGIYCYSASEDVNAQETAEYLKNYLRLSDVDGDLIIYTQMKSFEKRLKELPPSDRDTADDSLLRQEGVLQAISM
ncbi:MAG: hypothetical protein IKR59_04260 [Lachnospiraceae bacterium]|nr:hypothetical protein [Lachnospiraceae bacterium]